MREIHRWRDTGLGPKWKKIQRINRQLQDRLQELLRQGKGNPALEGGLRVEWGQRGGLPRENDVHAEENRKRFFKAEISYLEFRSALLIVKKRVAFNISITPHALSLWVLGINWENSGNQLPALLQNNWNLSLHEMSFNCSPSPPPNKRKETFR